MQPLEWLANQRPGRRIICDRLNPILSADLSYQTTIIVTYCRLSRRFHASFFFSCTVSLTADSRRRHIRRSVSRAYDSLFSGRALFPKTLPSKSSEFLRFFLNPVPAARKHSPLLEAPKNASYLNCAASDRHPASRDKCCSGRDSFPPWLRSNSSRNPARTLDLSYCRRRRCARSCHGVSRGIDPVEHWMAVGSYISTVPPLPAA